MRTFLMMTLLIGSLSQGYAKTYDCPTSLEGLQEDEHTGKITLASGALNFEAHLYGLSLEQAKIQKLHRMGWWKASKRLECIYGENKVKLIANVAVTEGKMCNIQGQDKKWFVDCPNGQCPSLVCSPAHH